MFILDLILRALGWKTEPPIRVTKMEGGNRTEVDGYGVLEELKTRGHITESQLCRAKNLWHEDRRIRDVVMTYAQGNVAAAQTATDLIAVLNQPAAIKR